MSDNGVGLQRAQAMETTGIAETTETHEIAHGEPDSAGTALTPTPLAPTAGARSGLLTHGALMSLVGGSLSVHSEPGAGATVSIRAPRSIAD